MTNREIVYVTVYAIPENGIGMSELRLSELLYWLLKYRYILNNITIPSPTKVLLFFSFKQ